MRSAIAPASPKAPTFGALLHTIHGVIRTSAHPTLTRFRKKRLFFMELI